MAKESAEEKESPDDKKYLGKENRDYGKGKYDDVIKDAMKFLAENAPHGGMVKIANPSGTLPPEGREEAKENKGDPADPTPPADTESKGKAKHQGKKSRPGEELYHMDFKKRLGDDAAKWDREGFVGTDERGQEAAPERGSDEKPPPDFMPDADPQDRQAIWEGLTPEQRDAIIAVSAAPAQPGGKSWREREEGTEITGGGRQVDREQRNPETERRDYKPRERSPISPGRGLPKEK
tara:strand:- start:6039 stop:6746 length:708 start_codon:yes stop_codon:yes gene_type:complete